MARPLRPSRDSDHLGRAGLRRSPDASTATGCPRAGSAGRWWCAKSVAAAVRCPAAARGAASASASASAQHAVAVSTVYAGPTAAACAACRRSGPDSHRVSCSAGDDRSAAGCRRAFGAPEVSADGHDRGWERLRRCSGGPRPPGGASGGVHSRRGRPCAAKRSGAADASAAGAGSTSASGEAFARSRAPAEDSSGTRPVSPWFAHGTPGSSRDVSSWPAAG